MLVLYETRTARNPLLAARVWRITTAAFADTVRINVYHDNRIERFISGAEGGMRPFDADGREAVLAWTMDGTEGGEPIGVPVIHFRNRGSSANNFGISELENVKPIQDVLNRTMYSMVSTAELTAFPIRLLVGAALPSAGISPATIFEFKGDTATGYASNEASQKAMAAIRMEQLSAGEIVPFVQQADWAISQMLAITSTPVAGGSEAVSGESLKQREIKLIGKVNRFETQNGNSWEDAVSMAARVGTAFSVPNTPVIEGSLDAKWADSEIRNDRELVEITSNLFRDGIIDLRTALEEIASVYGWDAMQIEEIFLRTSGEQQVGGRVTPLDTTLAAQQLNDIGLGELVAEPATNGAG
jgi:hypothetical protein